MRKLLLLTTAIVCLVISAWSQTLQPFKNGDRAVFLGNSITDGGHYHSYIWLYYMTRFPEMNVRIFNAGIGGDTAGDMFKRLDDDVFSKKPTVLTVTFGMNDTGYFEYNQNDAKAFGDKKYKECYDNYKKIEARLKALSNTRIVMLGSSPYEETSTIENTAFKGKNAVMQRVVEFQKTSSEENIWEFVDLNGPMTELSLQQQIKDPKFALCGGDRIHPDNDGHMVMAYLYLKAQGFVGVKVADILVDAATAKVVKAENCKISKVKKVGKDLYFNYMAKSLPYPLDTMTRGWGSHRGQAKVVETVPFMEQMNQELLAVSGLEGNYKLFIDEEEIGTWNASNLAAGINLAEHSKTPQYQQALSVMNLNEYRWEIERNFRELAWLQFNFFQPRGLLFANNRKSIEVLDKEKEGNAWVNMHRDVYSKLIYKDVRDAREEQMELLIDKIYKSNKPIQRKIVLRKID